MSENSIIKGAKNRTVMRERGQVTIPAPIRAAARLDEGDPIEIEIVEEGILLRPQKLVDASQAWFWTSAWQKREREADADLAASRLDRFESDEELIAAFEARLKPLDADA
jgi:AbrB family looped-hinge helix DNA binding protein